LYTYFLAETNDLNTQTPKKQKYRLFFKTLCSCQGDVRSGKSLSAGSSPVAFPAGVDFPPLPSLKKYVLFAFFQRNEADSSGGKTRRLLWESAMVFGGASNRSPSVKTPQKKWSSFFEEAERKPMESVVFFRSGRVNLTTLVIPVPV